MNKKLIFAVILAVFTFASVAHADGVDGIWNVIDDDGEPDLFMLRENNGVYIMVTLNDMDGTDWSAYSGTIQGNVVHMTTVVDSDADTTFDMVFTTPAQGPITTVTITLGTCTPKVPGGCGDPGDWPTGLAISANKIF